MRGFAGLLAAMLLAACVRESAHLEKRMSAAEGLIPVKVSTSITGEEPGHATRSILDEDSIETLVTGVTLASYSAEGKLIDVCHYQDGVPDMELWVNAAGGNTIYALVNMGDMTGRFPVDEREVEKMTYRLATFDEVALSGIPMCGKAVHVGADDLPVMVDVERLFAKVRIRILHTMLEGAGSGLYAYNLCNESIYMRQANSLLCPFGPQGSRAARRDDVWEESDYNPDLNDRDAYHGSLPVSQLGPGPGYFQDTTLVFYLPENNQGALLPDNEYPAAKVYDSISLIDGVPYGDLCTYVELNARRENTGNGYSGDLTYRFYLGCDNTSDFSLKRNSVYDVILNLSERNMLSDCWEVTRGENWKDTRVLKFLEGPYVIYQGQSEKVMVHYHKATSGVTSSQPLPDDWSMELDEEALEMAGLSYVFDPDVLVKGENGMSDFCLEFHASADAPVGSVLPLKIVSWDGGLIDHSTVTVARLGVMTAGWDIPPKYVSQYGMVTARGVPDSKKPVSLNCDVDGKVEVERVNDTTFRVVARSAGCVTLAFSNADGSQRCETELDVMPPRLEVTPGVINLNPDGGFQRLSYAYLDNDGNRLENVDRQVCEEVLWPVVTGSEYIISESSEGRLDVGIGRLSSDGVSLVPGNMYNVEVRARGCSQVNVCSRVFHVEDPFKSIVSMDDYGRIDDYTLFSLPGVEQSVRDCYEDRIWADDGRAIPAPVPEASSECVSAEMRPVWKDGYSSDNEVYMLDQTLEAGVRCWRIRVCAPDVGTCHSAGLHDVVLSVRNRHSGECWEKICGTMQIYVHTMLGATASFGYERGYKAAADGRTMAQVYNSLAGREIYRPDSYMYYMDVRMDYLTPVDGVRLLSVLRSSAMSNTNSYDSLYLIQPSSDDGHIDAATDLLYSVMSDDPARISLGEPYGVRSGIGNILYRAFKMKNCTAPKSDSEIKADFLGYDGRTVSYMYRPRYSIHDVSLGYDDESNVVDVGKEYGFSPSSFASCVDSHGDGYYVIHFLDKEVPDVAGWTDLL